MIDISLIIGELLFGIGWGISGWCPGPAMFLAFAGYPYLLYRWWPMFFVGAFIGEQIKTLKDRFKKCQTITGLQEDTKGTEAYKNTSNYTLDVDHSAREENTEAAYA